MDGTKYKNTDGWTKVPNTDGWDGPKYKVPMDGMDQSTDGWDGPKYR